MTHKSNLFGFLLVGYDWLIIGLCVYISESFLPLWGWLLMVPIIGSRMMAFASLVHDASHYLLFRTKWLNEFVGEVFLAWPVGRLCWHFKYYHLVHHSHLRTEKDAEYPLNNYQEFHFPKNKHKLIFILLFDLLGINFIVYQIKKLPQLLHSKTAALFKENKNYWLYTRARLATYIIIIASAIWFDFYILLIKYWLVPFATWYAMVFRIRAIAEHFMVPETKAFQTRTLILSKAEKFFFFPHNVNFHTEHHLHPGIPCYKLPQAHKEFKKIKHFVSNTHFTKGLSNLFNELTGVPKHG